MASTWDDICKSVDGFAKKANRKMEQLSENAAVRLKITAKKAELEDAYLELGKLTYRSATTAPEAEVDPRVQKSIEGIGALIAEIESLQQKIAPAEETQTEK